MPVVHITMLEPDPAPDWGAASSSIALRVAEGFGCDPASVWCVIAPVPPGAYAVGPETGASQPRGSHDPIVRISAFAGRDEDTIARAIEHAAGAVAEAFGLEPGTAFVVYEELAPGRVFTGGAIRR